MRNAKVMANELEKRDYKIISNGTDNHIILIDLNNKNITGSKIEKLCEKVNISINKNSVPGDTSAISPGGIRLGTPTVTTRGMDNYHMVVIANLLDEIINLAIDIQNTFNCNKLSEFINIIENNDNVIDNINNIKERVINFSKQFYC